MNQPSNVLTQPMVTAVTALPTESVQSHDGHAPAGAVDHGSLQRIQASRCVETPETPAFPKKRAWMMRENTRASARND